MIPWKDREKFGEKVTPKNIVDAVHELRNRPGANIPGQLKNTDGELVGIDQLKEDHIIVDMSPMHYGMQEKNPLDEVRWYSDSDLDSEPLVCLLPSMTCLQAAIRQFQVSIPL